MRLHLVTFLVILLCRGISTDAPNSTTSEPSTTPNGVTSALNGQSTSTSKADLPTSTGDQQSKTSIVTTVADTTNPSVTTLNPGTGSTIVQSSTTKTTTTTATQAPQTGSTDAPASAVTTTQNIPTTTVGVTTATWNIPLNNTDPTDLLRAIANLNNTVSILKANLDDLYNGVNVNGSNNYITQLKNLNATIAQLNTDGLQAQINNTKNIYSATLTNIQPLFDTLQCFKNSPCVVVPSPSPSMCPPILLNATSTSQQFSYASGLEYNCMTELNSSDGDPIVYTLNLTLTGKAQLIVQDIGGNVQANYTTNQINKTESLDCSSFISFIHLLKKEDTISLSVIYNIRADCGNGTCVVVDGKPICNCLGVSFWGPNVKNTTRPCVGSQVTESVQVQVVTVTVQLKPMTHVIGRKPRFPRRLQSLRLPRNQRPKKAKKSPKKAAAPKAK
ncbi:unnamed protein product, partial [Mesorhabditis belari]|uniref:Uncharacterized protein n=1 Tax=Mesorhabditis belari TaxID=2138241 RepID=A0AAF3FMP9_9BILA